MLSSLLNILHDQFWIRKNMMIDPLKDISNRSAPLPTCDNIGIVDVALGPRMAFLELGHNLKLTDKFL